MHLEQVNMASISHMRFLQTLSFYLERIIQSKKCNMDFFKVNSLLDLT